MDTVNKLIESMKRYDPNVAVIKVPGVSEISRIYKNSVNGNEYNMGGIPL